MAETTSTTPVTTALDTELSIEALTAVKVEDIRTPKPTEVNFQKPTVDYTATNPAVEEITSVTFNRPAETLKVSMNEALVKVTQGFTDLDSQITALRLADANQTTDLVAKINATAGALFERVTFLLTGLNATNTTVNAISEFINNPTSGLADKLATVNKALSDLGVDLKTEDLDLFAEIAENKDRLNNLRITHHFTISQQPVNGIMKLDTRAEGVGEFTDESQFMINVNLIEGIDKVVHITNKTKDGCDFLIRSFGKHYQPQPISGELVKLSIVLTHMPFTVLKMDAGRFADRLNVA